MAVDPAVRRAALIATVVTVPLVLAFALLLGGGSGGGSPGGPSATPSNGVLPPVSATAPPDSSAATVTTCAKVISALPLKLAGLSLRRTVSNPPSSSIVAWGDPPIVLRCGVARPAALDPSLSQELFAVDGVLFLPQRNAQRTVWTAVDRSVYVDVAVPTSYHQPPLGPIATALAKVLKPVCVQDPSKPRAQQCTRRK